MAPVLPNRYPDSTDPNFVKYQKGRKASGGVLASGLHRPADPSARQVDRKQTKGPTERTIWTSTLEKEQSAESSGVESTRSPWLDERLNTRGVTKNAALPTTPGGGTVRRLLSPYRSRMPGSESPMGLDLTRLSTSVLPSDSSPVGPNQGEPYFLLTSFF